MHRGKQKENDNPWLDWPGEWCENEVDKQISRYGFLNKGLMVCCISQ